MPPMKGSAAIAAIAQRRTQSLASMVRDELERMILSGELAAGARLNEQALASRLGVSRGPVREATRALERAGLVTAIPNTGVFVRQISMEEALELYDMRAVIFGFACWRLAGRATQAQKTALRALVRQMDEAIEATDASAYFRLNLQFHDEVMELSGHRRAAGIYESLVKEAHLFRQRSLLTVDAMRQSNAEHARIVEAIEAGDRMAARAAAEEHHHGGKSRWLQTLQE